MNVEQMLRGAGANLEWPRTPAIADAVAARLEPAVTPAHRWGRRWTPPVSRALAVALGALVLLVATAAAIPGVREPVLDWLGLRTVRVERIQRPLAEPPGSRLALGRHTTLARAREQLGFIPLVPVGIGPPTVWYEASPPGGQLSLVLPGHVLITELQGELERQYLFKFLHSGTGVETFRIEGGRALWLEGVHQYAYADRTGAPRTDTVRTAGSTLLWRRGELLIRIEGARTKARAARIARSLRAAP